VSPYLFRLICLSLAVFFVVNFAMGAILACLSGAALRISATMRARQAARFLFALRIAPALAAVLLVIGLCIPSYLRLEPQAEPEQVGGVCLAAALAALVLWIRSTVQSGRAVLQARRYLGSCREAGEEMQFDSYTTLVVNQPKTMALAGLFRPVLIVSQDIVDALPVDQIEAAILHERSHATAHDNLSRLALLVGPSVFPLDKLKRAWQKYAEWAADDMAVAGDSRRAIALAEALVSVARMGAIPHPSPLTTSFVGEDIAARVERLLDDRAPEPSGFASWWTPLAAISIMGAAIFFRASTFNAIHNALERLVH
jgi:beta-lactamase regulating signal transducer with metallopeptidase domain